MKIGLHISDFTYPDGPVGLRDNLVRIAEAAEANGFDRISVMDHLWQIDMHDGPDHEMLEAYTALGFLAAHTTRVELMAWVTAVSYREPGMLAKMISTLDVLSGGRAWLGIGAGWNVAEATGLGLPFPPLAERFERLEEALQICLRMWGDDDGPFEGRHYHLGRTLDCPHPLTRPHPPILIGGGGEKKTLLLVARYAQACNLFYSRDLVRKLDVLRAHCAREGRNYDDIEKTVMMRIDPGRGGENIAAILRIFEEVAALGVTEIHGTVAEVWRIAPLELIGRELVPAIAGL